MLIARQHKFSPPHHSKSEQSDPSSPQQVAIQLTAAVVT